MCDSPLNRFHVRAHAQCLQERDCCNAFDVNGNDADPIFKYLTSSAPGLLGSEAIKWNFTKFLINKNGDIVKRFAPNVAPEDISPEIEKLL
jgi:glutathione peroxidase